MTNTGQSQENNKIHQPVPAAEEEIVVREESAANEVSAVEETHEEEVCAASEDLSAVEEIVFLPLLEETGNRFPPANRLRGKHPVRSAL